MSISIRFAYHTDIRVFDLINEKKNVNEITDKRSVITEMRYPVPWDESSLWLERVGFK